MPKKPKLELLDPQQIAFLQALTDPKSKTFGNYKQSAIAVGYSETYADNLTNLMPKWLSDNIGQEKMLKKAEKNLEEFLDLNTVNTFKDKKGEIVTGLDPQLLNVKLKATTFVASRAGKGKWSEKQEIETKNLNVNVDIKQNKKAEAITAEYEEKLIKELENKDK